MPVRMTTSEFSNVYSFAKPQEIYHANVSFKHWQLRDMLKICDGEMVFTTGEKVLKKYESYEPEILIDELPFSPTTFDISEQFFACGSAQGEIMLLNRFTNESYALTNGKTIVNAVKIRDNYLYICSNEKNLKVFDMGKLAVTSIYNHSTQVNNCELSADGSIFSICGDSKEVIVFSVNGGCLMPVKSLDTIDDGGFGISWNGPGSLLAVGTQDGYVCIWDSRNFKRIATLKSLQHPYIGGAVRTLQFTQHKLLDLLVFIEHFSNFSIVDARDFKKRQIVNINEDLPDASLTGLAINTENDSFYISTRENISKFKVNQTYRRTFCDGDYF